MKRIDIRYAGEHYSISGRDFNDVRAEVETAVLSGRPHWLQANFGEGSVRASELLIAPGTSIALIPIDEE